MLMVQLQTRKICILFDSDIIRAINNAYKVKVRDGEKEKFGEALQNDLNNLNYEKWQLK